MRPPSWSTRPPVHPPAATRENEIQGSENGSHAGGKWRWKGPLEREQANLAKCQCHIGLNAAARGFILICPIPSRKSGEGHRRGITPPKWGLVRLCYRNPWEWTRVPSAARSSTVRTRFPSEPGLSSLGVWSRERNISLDRQTATPTNHPD